MVGSPVHWALQGAVFGGVLGWLAPAYLSLVAAAFFGGSGMPIGYFWPVGYAAGALGALVGLAQPAFLDQVRGRIPLPLLCLAQGAVGAAVGALLVAAAAFCLGGLLHPGALDLPMAIAAGTGGAMAAVSWLPITVATVLRVRTVPVTLACAAGIPTTLLLLALGAMDALGSLPVLLGF